MPARNGLQRQRVTYTCGGRITYVSLVLPPGQREVLCTSRARAALLWETLQLKIEHFFFRFLCPISVGYCKVLPGSPCGPTVACGQCAARQSSGRARARRPGQLSRQDGGTAGLGLAGALLESERRGRACAQLLAIGEADWGWSAVGRIERVARNDGVWLQESKHVRFGCRFVWAKVVHRRKKQNVAWARRWLVVVVIRSGGVAA